MRVAKVAPDENPQGSVQNDSEAQPPSPPSGTEVPQGEDSEAEEQGLLDRPTDTTPWATLDPPTRPNAGNTLRGSLNPGERLGAYQILGELGEGGMARVYLAEGPDGARVALKVLRAVEAEVDTTLRDRFEREGEVMSTIAHPNVVQLLDRGEVPELGLRYLALEHVPGFDLSTLLSRCPARRLSVPEAALVLSRCALGLAAVHEAGVLHRDLKPANVLITRRGQVKLIDFGIALGGDHVQRLTERDYVIGTLLYLAPEVLLDSDWKPAADIYALGCVAYRMLTGRLPFVTLDLKELLRAHEEDTPPPAHDVVETVPLGFSQLLARMLAHDPDERPSATEVDAELTRLGVSESTLQVAEQWARGRVGSGEFGTGTTLDTGDEPTDAEDLALARLASRPQQPIESGHDLGPYRVIRLLDRGAMGEVYLCEHEGERCAVKVVAAELIHDEESLIRFEREMDALIRVAAHPGIVGVRAQGCTKAGRPWFAMDYVEGRTLRKALEAGLPLAESLDAIEQLSHALAYAHAQGLVHRDLKPDNVLLADDGRCLLVDFGLTKAVGRHTQTLTRTGEILGTPSYMAPEQVDPELGGVGPWTDVYQLGCLLYRVLAERPPYTGGSPVEVYSKLLRGVAIPSLRKLVPELEPGLAELCHTALARDPGDRFRDAGVMSAELSQELAPPPRDRLLRALLTVTVLSLLLVGGALILSQFRHTAGLSVSYAQDVTRLRDLIADSRFEEAVGAGESLLASLPDEESAFSGELVEIADLLETARVQRAGEAFAAGDTATARALLRQVAVGVPDAPWILAASGEPRAALAAADASQPARVARLAAWAGEPEALREALAALSPARAEALAWELAEFSGVHPAVGRHDPEDPWTAIARGERSLATGLPGLAAVAFAQARGDDAVRLAAAFGLLRVAVARGDCRGAVSRWRETRELVTHPLDIARLHSWACGLSSARGDVPPKDAEQITEWALEAARRGPGLPRTQLALRSTAPEQVLSSAAVPILVRAEEAAAARGPAAGRAVLGLDPAGSFLPADRVGLGQGLGGPEGLLLARGLQLAQAAHQGRDARRGLEAEHLLAVATRCRPWSPAGWVGLAWAQLARREPELALQSARRARALCADGRVGLVYVHAVVAGLAEAAVKADGARARGQADPVAELGLASGWLKALEAVQSVQASSEPDPEVSELLGLWSARCRLERARRLVAAGSETLLAPSAELRLLLAGVEADTQGALAGLDVTALVAARVELGLALLSDDPGQVLAAEESLAAQARPVTTARRARVLQALALRASAWTGQPRAHAEAYLALASDLPARAALALQRARASQGGATLHMERARHLQGDDPRVLLVGELGKFSDTVVAAFADDAAAFRGLARVVTAEPAWCGLVLEAVRARPLAPNRLEACLQDLGGAQQALPRALALLSASWHAEGHAALADQALAAASAAAVDSGQPAAYVVRALALGVVGRGVGISKPDRAVLPELEHALVCAMAAAPASPTPRQLALHAPNTPFASMLDGLLADGFVSNAETLLEPVDGSPLTKPELERWVRRLRERPAESSLPEWLAQNGAARAASSQRLSAARGEAALEPDWPLLSGDDPALEHGLQASYARRRGQVGRAVAAAAAGLAHAIAEPLDGPAGSLPGAEAGTLLATLRARAWPADSQPWAARHVSRAEVLVDLVLGREAHAPAHEVSAFDPAAAFAPWGRLAALLAGPRDPRLQALAGGWLLESDWIETRLALERVLAFAPDEAPRLLAEVAFTELVPVARALSPPGGIAAWRALGSLAQRTLALTPGGRAEERALRALAVDALLFEAGHSRPGSVTSGELLELAWDQARAGARVPWELEQPLWGAWRRLRLLAALGRTGPNLERTMVHLLEHLEIVDPEQLAEWRLAARSDPWLEAIRSQPACKGLEAWWGE